MRTRDPAGKRQALIHAGLSVAEREGLARLSVNEVVAEAGVSKGSFFHLFGDRAAYLVEVHRRFHDRLAETIDGAVAGREPGRARLWAGTLAYLQGCLAERATRALLVDARTEPAVAAEVGRRSRMFADLSEPDFAAAGHPTPAEAALLWVAMTRECAVAEATAGGELPELRAALRFFLGDV